jgi:hypothetical protein
MNFFLRRRINSVKVNYNALNLISEQAPKQAPEDDNTTPYRVYYLHLCTLIQEHLLGGSEPKLALSQKPTGAFDWLPQ